MGGGCVARQLYPQLRKRPIDDSQRGFVPLALVSSPRGKYRIRGAIVAARAHSFTNQSNRPSNGEKPAVGAITSCYAIALPTWCRETLRDAPRSNTRIAMRLP
jgi:hypothetical protein